jgi:hypothetical protein
MIVEGQFLLAMRRVFRVIEVKDNGGRGRGVTRQAVGHERPGEAVEVRAGPAVVEPGEGRGPRQVLGGGERDPLDAELQQRVVPETVGIIAVCVAGGEWIETLGAQVPPGMGNRGRMALVAYGGRQAFCEADLPVEATQEQGSKVGRQGPPVKIGPDGVPRNGRKTELFWSRIRYQQTSCGSYGIGRYYTLFYQRLARGLCLFMNNPG